MLNSRRWLVFFSLICSGIVSSTANATGPQQNFLTRHGENLVLRKSMLEAPLLLLVAQVESTSDPEPLLFSPTPLLHFSRNASTLQLMQERRGETAQSLNVTPLLLTTFPIVAEDPDTITFAFHAGGLAEQFMRTYATADSATQSNQLLLNAPASAPTHGAYFRADSAGPGWYSVEEVVGGAGAVLRFTFWDANASTMTPRLDDPTDQIGLFTLPLQHIGRTSPDHIVRRWNLSQPLTFFISANTPATFRGAVREGVLAWNSAFGHEVLKVADAPASARPGDPRFPLIQWVEDATGLAIGMSQSHPLTGETLTALITVRSGWTQLHNDGDFLVDGKSGDDHESAVLCRYDATDMAADWEKENVAALDESTRRQIVLQQLRTGVMHEVGHVLGLRHNFAGSLDSQIDPANDADDLQSAMRGERPNDAPLPSSSVMDYLIGPDAIRMSTPGIYDRAAIAWAYELSDLSQLDQTQFHFCTDFQAGQIADCERHDSQADPLDWWDRELESCARAVSQWMVDNIIVPPEQMNQLTADTSTYHHIVGRLLNAQQTVRTYLHANTWVIAGHYPYERKAHALAILQHYFGNTMIDPQGMQLALHPLVRPPLTAAINQLTAQAAQPTDDGRWARQVLANLVSAFRDFLQPPEM